MELNISLSPDILFYLGSFPVTNTLLWSFVISAFLIILTLIIKSSLKLVPGRLQNLIEVMIEGAYSFVSSIVGNDKKTKRIFPLVFTMFIFTLIANLVVFIPGQSAITMHNGENFVPVFRAVMSDYGLVFMMTLITVITTQIVAITAFGPLHYVGKFICLGKIKDFFLGALKGKFDFGVLAQGFLDFFLGIMDIIGELAKVISLSFRLFGNIFAGEVLTSVMLFLAPFVVPLPFALLGLLTAIVQAFVFSVLTLIFITMASERQEEAA